jgi:hypothetical protein
MPSKLFLNPLMLMQRSSLMAHSSATSNKADTIQCEDLMRGGSKSFFAASRVLPKRVRNPAIALYAFCRLMDDIVDEGGEDIQLDPMVEARLAPLLAQASKQLLQSNQAQVAQQQAQQQAQDPIIQMQQQELQLKAAEQQRKVQKDQVDAQLKLKQLEIEHERIVSQAKTAQQQAKIGALKTVAEHQNQRKMEEVRLKQDSIKTVANLENQRMVNKQKLFADGLKTAHMVHKEKPTKGEK